MVSVKLRVASGAPLQLNVGERSSAPSPDPRAQSGSWSPSAKSGLDRSKLGTSGRFQFGSFTM